MKTYSTPLLFLFYSISFVSAQPTADQLDSWSNEHLLAGITELREYLSLPNNGLYVDHVKPNMVWTEEAFEKRGFSTQRIETAGIDVHSANQIVVDGCQLLNGIAKFNFNLRQSQGFA